MWEQFPIGQSSTFPSHKVELFRIPRLRTYIHHAASTASICYGEDTNQTYQFLINRKFDWCPHHSKWKHDVLPVSGAVLGLP